MYILHLDFGFRPEWILTAEQQTLENGINNGNIGMFLTIVMLL